MAGATAASMDAVKPAPATNVSRYVFRSMESALLCRGGGAAVAAPPPLTLRPPGYPDFGGLPASTTTRPRFARSRDGAALGWRAGPATAAPVAPSSPVKRDDSADHLHAATTGNRGMRHPLASGHVPSAWWHSGANRAGTARSAVGQECGEPLVLAGDEGTGHRHQDFVRVGHARPRRVARRIRTLDLSPLRACLPGSADLAVSCRAATRLHQGRCLLQDG